MTQIQPPPAPAPFDGPPPPGFAPSGFAPPAGPRPVNALAIASLVLAFVVAPLGAVLGFVAKSQIRRRGERGSGLATAGIVLGVLFTLIGAVAVVFAVNAMNQLSSDSLKSEVSRTVSDAVGVAPSSVTCPDSIERKAGTVTVCTATIDGTDVTVTATQRDNDGNVDIKGTRWVSTQVIAKSIDDTMSKSAGMPVTTTCADGRKVVVGGAGTTFECTTTAASDPSAAQKFTITVTDDAGNVTLAPAG